MITPEKLLMLETAAQEADGRKELRCQFAMADLYKAADLLPGTLEIPNGPRDWSRSQGQSLIVEWLEKCPQFVKVPAPAEPGDLIVFRLGHTPHHVAIQLGDGRLVHVFGDHGVKTAPCIPTPWAKRIDSIWRIA